MLAFDFVRFVINYFLLLIWIICNQIVKNCAVSYIHENDICGFLFKLNIERQNSAFKLSGSLIKIRQLFTGFSTLKLGTYLVEKIYIWSFTSTYYQWCRTQGGHWPPQYLADPLTLFQLGRADYPHLSLHTGTPNVFHLPASLLFALQSSVLVANRAQAPIYLIRVSFLYLNLKETNQCKFNYKNSVNFSWMMFEISYMYMILEKTPKWLILRINAKFECPPLFTYVSGRPSIESFYK